MWLNSFIDAEVEFDLSGNQSLLGRSIVVSKLDEKDGNGKVTKGSRVACCTIKEAKQTNYLTEHFAAQKTARESPNQRGLKTILKVDFDAKKAKSLPVYTYDK